MFSRRQFVRASAAAAGSLLVSPFLSSNYAVAADAKLPPLPGPLLQRPIPSTGEMIPIIGSGTSGSFNVPVGSDEYENLRHVTKAFFAAGATIFDTSPNYGNADTVLGEILHQDGWREQTFLATKIAADNRQMAEQQWRESQRRLHTDSVELLQVHNLRDWKTQLKFANELKASGKTKYVGVTHYLESGLSEMTHILNTEPLDFIQIHYSVNAPEAAETVLPLAQEKGVAVLINRAFDDGRLFGVVKNQPLPDWAAEVEVQTWAQLFLKFALSHPAVTAVIPATSKLKHQVDNLGAGTGPMLNAAQQQQLITLFR
ncbi:Aldo/keto reductase precursor [Methylophaga frappieri]|uniref:Aldo/keto reductase n=1 Tax=Methylophaga frappieri (strain ATCC BAA-2434 / DSM 25690 / JAM7) TaxID=754477 RepID=I1YJX8_METFJ|nr:aldo/keto reductase [Methylophaga frappieri]AFJ03221.1 Aldo/keto reductase precursor [Methylophaga frappieri]